MYFLHHSHCCFLFVFLTLRQSCYHKDAACDCQYEATKNGCHLSHVCQAPLTDINIVIHCLDIRRLVWKAVNINFLDIMKEVSERLSYVSGV